MQASVSKMVDRINDLIPDNSADPTSGSRAPRASTTCGLFDVVDSVSSYLFGTAAAGQLDELRETIKKIETEAETGAADKSRTPERSSPNYRMSDWTS